MAIVGLIPFVYATIKRKRRRSSMARDAGSYAYAGLGGNAARHARGAYQSHSCHFAVRPSLDNEFGFSYDDYSYSAALCPPPKAEGLSREPLRGRESARFDGEGDYLSQSCRFAVRPSLVDELVVSRHSGGSRRPPAQPEALSRQMLPPASIHDGLATGAARGQGRARPNGSSYQSQSCRFVVHHSAAYEHGLLHDEEYGAGSTSPEDLSGKLLLPTGRNERGLSRSRRFSSKRVFAWVSGA